MHLAPVNVFEELLDETILLRPSPDNLRGERITQAFVSRDRFLSHSCIGVIKQETNADNRDVFYLFDVLSNKGT